ncbi:MAG: hypothetical protein EXS37_18820 [Opitutus sp.]|nr:hypothetical protein [Opitutus sp.]
MEGSRLELNLASDSHQFRLVGEWQARAIAGEWKQVDGTDHGTWSARQSDLTAPEDNSPAVVALFEYTLPDGERIYSTDAELPKRTAQRSARPICRVWRNPLAVLVLDPEARPVLATRR